jgi:hypothetical protein
MGIVMRSLAGSILALGVMAGCGMAQETVQEKRVKDIKAEQTRDVIFASPVCQRARDHGSWVIRTHQVSPATLEPDLSRLMEKSDEVVLAGYAGTSTAATSPSQEDVVKYFDVKVLRSWKGSHKVGDTLTFAIPDAVVRCTTSLANGEPEFLTLPVIGDWKELYWGAFVLFLRHSQAGEAQLIPGLRLTAGDGEQGMFQVQLGIQDSTCDGVPRDGAEKCNAYLEASQIPVADLYVRDPLFKKYDGMPVSSFLQEIQATADSLGDATQANATK